jgi:phosphatidylglycerophosphatase A
MNRNCAHDSVIHAGPLDRAAVVVATVLGVGFAPLAPGTCGTAAAVGLAWALASLAPSTYALATLAVTLAGVAAAQRAARVWGTHDDRRIVIDEVAGYLVTVLAVDRSNGWALAAGFVVFRVLDIAKPPPIRSLERLPGGWGVMLDDVGAGVVGAILMAALGASGLFGA